MRHTSRVFVSCCVAALAACAPADEPEADDAAIPPATTPAATPQPAGGALTAADLAGRWNVTSTPETGDTVATAYEMNMTGDTTGWTLTFPGRPPLPVRVLEMGGDSIVTEVGPYESVRRAGVQVVTSSVLRLQGERLTGRSTARYQGGGADSVVVFRTEGMRAQ